MAKITKAATDQTMPSQPTAPTTIATPAQEGSDRDHLYAQFEARQAAEQAKEDTPPVVTGQAVEPPSIAPEDIPPSVEVPPVPEAAPTSPPAPEPVAVTPPVTNPYDKSDWKHHAYQEERERRKEETQRRKELEARVKELEATVVKSQTSQDPEVYVDPDEKLKRLEAEVAELRSTATEAKQFVETQKQRSFDDELRQKVATARAEIERRGIPISPYFEQLVGYELNQQLLKNPNDPAHVQEIMRQDSDPMAWANIYCEQVWPKQAPLVERSRAATAQPQKDALKRQAALLGSPGSVAPPPKPESEEETPQQYLERRMHSGPIRRGG